MTHLGGPALIALASASEALAAFLVGALVARSGGPDALGRLAASLALLCVGEEALALAFGEAFASSGAPLRVLALTFLVGSVDSLLILALYARRREREAVRALAAALVVNLLANLLLIARHGATGAAVASLASESLLAGLYWRALRRAEPAAVAPTASSLARSGGALP